jgi:5-methylcytosine-specific restriction enzyme subunit McrC
MLSTATGLRLESPTAASQRTTRANLLEIVVLKFIDELEALLHRGLAKGYRQLESNGPTFRGRLLIAENLRENAARADRFYVRHQTYDADVTINRILGVVLAQVVEIPLPSVLAARVRACRSVLPELSAIRALPALFDRLVLGRSTERYRTALTLGRMILECISPELRAGPHAVFALLFDMNDLWERYVGTLFRKANVPGLVVSTQESQPFWKPSGERARAVRPDIVVRTANTSETILVVDTKWKVPRDGRPSDDDLKQMFVYNQLLGSPRSLLLYPSAGTANNDGTGEFIGHEHTCGKAYLGLFEDEEWSDARMRADVRRILTNAALSVG